MSVSLFRKICAVRESKVERAQRECHRIQDELVLKEQALALARDAHCALQAGKQAASLRWRSERLALEPFDSNACDSHQVTLARWDRKIAQALDVVTQRSAQRDECARALDAARKDLMRKQMELTKAQSGVAQHRLLQQQRDDAIEEDELDELAVLRPRQVLLETRA